MQDVAMVHAWLSQDVVAAEKWLVWCWFFVVGVDQKFGGWVGGLRYKCKES